MQSNPGATDEGVDDSALDNALSDDEEENFSNINLAEHLSKIDSVAPSEVPQREGLYSTPLSWERPQPGLRMDSIMSIQSPATLDQAEQRRLIAIAMNPGSSSGGLGSSLANQYQYDTSLGPMGPGLGAAAMSQIVNVGGTHPQTVRPTATYPPYHPPREGSMNDKGKDKVGKPGDRTAHNDIERKYRTNLKDKIAELRDAVPALRTIPENDVDDGEEGGQPSRGPKVSKVGLTNMCLGWLAEGLETNETNFCLFTGRCSHQGDRVHPLPGEEKQGDRAAAPGALQAASGL